MLTYYTPFFQDWNAPFKELVSFFPYVVAGPHSCPGQPSFELQATSGDLNA